MPVPLCFYADYSHQFNSQSSRVYSPLCIPSSLRVLCTFCISAFSPQPQFQFSFRASDLIRHFLLPVARRPLDMLDSSISTGPYVDVCRTSAWLVDSCWTTVEPCFHFSFSVRVSPSASGSYYGLALFAFLSLLQLHRFLHDLSLATMITMTVTSMETPALGRC